MLDPHLASYLLRLSFRRISCAIPGNEFFVGWHRLRAARDDMPDVFDELVELEILDQVNQRVIASRRNPLSEHHLYPTDVGEQLLVLPIEPATATKQLHVLDQPRRHAHAAAVIPECSIGALCGVVMQDQEVTHTLPFECRLLIEALYQHWIEPLVREKTEQQRDG